MFTNVNEYKHLACDSDMINAAVESDITTYIPHTYTGQATKTPVSCFWIFVTLMPLYLA